MYPRSKLEKARIRTVDETKPKQEYDVWFPFNPTEIAIERGCGFESTPPNENSVNDFGGLKFGGAKSDQLTMSFIVDSTELSLTNPANALVMMSPVIASTPTIKPAKDAASIPILGKAVNGDSVTDVLDKLLAMTKLSEQAKKDKKADKDKQIFPRLVEFTWGKEIKFTGAIEKFSFKLTLFDSDGTPKRAEVEMGIIGVYGDFKGSAQDLVFAEGTSKKTSTAQLKQK